MTPLYGPVGLTECHGCQRERASVRWACFAWPGHGAKNFVPMRFCGLCVTRLLVRALWGALTAGRRPAWRSRSSSSSS